MEDAMLKVVQPPNLIIPEVIWLAITAGDQSGD